MTGGRSPVVLGLAAFALALPVALFPGCGDGAEAVSVVSTRLGDHGDTTRLVLELTAHAAYVVSAGSAADQMVIELPGVAWSQGTGSRSGDGQVRRYRFEATDGGGRFVLETRGPMRVRRAFEMPPEGGHALRLVLDLEAVPSSGPVPASVPVVPTVPAPPPVATAPAVVSARLTGKSDKARFVLELTEPVAYRIDTAADPYRLLVHLPSLTGLDAAAPQAGPGLIRSARLEPEAGGSRLVLVADGPVRLKASAVLPPSAGQRSRLVLDLVPIDADSFIATETAPAMAEPPPVAPPVAPPVVPPVAVAVPPPAPPPPIPPAVVAAPRSKAPQITASVPAAPPPAVPPVAAFQFMTPVPAVLGPVVTATALPPPMPEAVAEVPAEAPPVPVPVPAEPLPAALGAPGAAPGAGTSVVATRIGTYPDKTRFVLELSDPVTYQVEADAGRVTVHLPKLGPSGAAEARTGRGLIRSYRIEPEADGGGSLAVLDTNVPARVKSAFVIPPSEGHRTRLVLDLMPGEGARAVVASAPALPAPSPSPAPQPRAVGEVTADLPRGGPLRGGRGGDQIAMLPAAPPPDEPRRPGGEEFARTVTAPVAIPLPAKEKPVAMGGSSQGLEQALSLAFSSNPTLGNARANLRAVDEGVSQARAQARPSASINASTGPNWDKSGIAGADSSQGTTPTNTVRTTPKSVGVSLTQPIYKGGQIEAGISQARNNVLAQQAALRDAEQTVLLQGATAYLDVALDQAIVELQTNFENFQKRDLQALRDRFKAGEINQTDVNLQEAQLASASAARMTAEGQLDADRATYLKLIGVAPGKLILPTLTYPLPGSLDEAISLAEQNTPRVINAKFTESAARDSIDVVDSALLPSVSLSANVGRNLDSSIRNDFTNSASVKANLTIPIDNGFNLARSRAARESANAARLNIDQVIRAAREAATTAWQRLMTSRNNLAYYQAAVQANEQAASGIRAQIATGTSTIIDLLNTEQALLNARVSLFRAHRDQAVAVFQILSATGRLDAETIGLIQAQDEQPAPPRRRAAAPQAGAVR